MIAIGDNNPRLLLGAGGEGFICILRVNFTDDTDFILDSHDGRFYFTIQLFNQMVY
jgi:hypothetical protein